MSSNNNAYFRAACVCARKLIFPALITRVGRVASEMKLPLESKKKRKVFARARYDKRKM